MVSILIIDDECQAVGRLANILTKLGYRVFTASSGREGLDKVSLLEPDIVLLDIDLGDVSGIDVFNKAVAKFQYIDKPLQICFVSGRDRSIIANLPNKPAGFIQKPVELDELRRLLKHLEKNISSK